MTTSLCPCNSQKNFNECCGPLLKGEKTASSPEVLMRSRYSAFVEKNVDYLWASMTTALQRENSRDELNAFINEVDAWVKLEIIDAPILSSFASEGEVEFSAYFTSQGKEHRLHERSLFIKNEGKWLYAGHSHQCGSHHHGQHDHAHHKHSHVSYQAHEKLGRNDPCACGSGKKYKKCCLLQR